MRSILTWELGIMLMALKSSGFTSKKFKSQLQAQKEKIKILEIELMRKEKVLMELSALLMLSPTFTAFAQKNIISGS